MNQQKSGEFLKHLRKDRGLTQEQLAEQFYVSTRTVSRWETGSNMPDLAMLIELADFYNVDIREIIDGERKSETMDNETKDTLKKVAEYTAEAQRKFKNKMLLLLCSSAFLLLLCDMLFKPETKGFLYGTVPENVCMIILGVAKVLGILATIIGLLYVLGVFDRFIERKK